MSFQTDTKRRNMMTSSESAEKMSQDDFSAWARHYQAHAGSDKAAEASSRLQSQSIFGDIGSITAEELVETTGYDIRVSGDETSSEMTFSSNKYTKEEKTTFDFKATLKINATVFLAAPKNSNEKYFQLEPVQINLLLNDEWLPEMNHSNPAVIRECQLTVAGKTLAEGKTDCIDPKISKVWDLMPDWDQWAEKRSAAL